MNIPTRSSPFIVLLIFSLTYISTAVADDYSSFNFTNIKYVGGASLSGDLVIDDTLGSVFSSSVYYNYNQNSVGLFYANDNLHTELLGQTYVIIDISNNASLPVTLLSSLMVTQTPVGQILASGDYNLMSNVSSGLRLPGFVFSQANTPDNESGSLSVTFNHASGVNVPEPSSIALLLSGILGFAASRNIKGVRVV